MDDQTIINEMAANSDDYLLSDGRLDVLALALDAVLMLELSTKVDEHLIDLALQAQDLNVERDKITPPFDRANQRDNIHFALYERNRNRRELTCGPVTVGDMIFVKGLRTEWGIIDTYLVCKTVMNGCARFSGYSNNRLIGEYRWDAGDLVQRIVDKSLFLCSL